VAGVCAHEAYRKAPLDSSQWTRMMKNSHGGEGAKGAELAGWLLNTWQAVRPLYADFLKAVRTLPHALLHSVCLPVVVCLN